MRTHGILALALAGCRAEGPITYAEVDGRALTLDVWEPADEGPHPGVLLIHGGGWRMGDLYAGGLQEQAATAAEAGFVVVSTNYRLSQEAIWPAQIEDVGCALRWMRAHADEIGLDPGRVGVAGHSAGGHLTLMLAEDPERAPPAWCDWRDEDGALQAAVSMAGPADLAFLYPRTTDWGRKVITELLGVDRAVGPEDAPEAYADASPIRFVDALGPPVWLVAGGLDALVPAEDAERLDEALVAAGRTSELEVLADQDHNTLGALENWLPAMEEALQP